MDARVAFAVCVAMKNDRLGCRRGNAGDLDGGEVVDPSSRSFVARYDQAKGPVFRQRMAILRVGQNHLLVAEHAIEFGQTENDLVVIRCGDANDVVIACPRKVSPLGTPALSSTSFKRDALPLAGWFVMRRCRDVDARHCGKRCAIESDRWLAIDDHADRRFIGGICLCRGAECRPSQAGRVTAARAGMSSRGWLPHGRLFLPQPIAHLLVARWILTRF